jgi:hypothetical protein
MAALFASKRTLTNGAGETVTVTTRPEKDTDPAWFEDTYRLAFALSNGDRSGLVAAFQSQQHGSDDTFTFVTAQGSVTQEFYERMCRFGYGRSEADTSLGLDGARKFVVHAHRLPVLMKLLFATKVEGTSGKPLNKVSKFIGKNLEIWAKNRLDVLLFLRVGFDQDKQPLQIPSKHPPPLFKAFRKHGLVGAPDGIKWPITPLGMTTMPFALDMVLERKGYDWKGATP